MWRRPVYPHNTTCGFKIEIREGAWQMQAWGVVQILTQVGTKEQDSNLKYRHEPLLSTSWLFIGNEINLVL